MKPSSRALITLLAGLAVVLALAVAAYWVVQARADGAQSRQSLAPVKVPAPSVQREDPAHERWTVGKVLRTVTVYARPDTTARVKTRLAPTTSSGYPTLVLLDTVRDTGSATWYRVWLALRPNGSRGWIREGDLGFYTTPARIVIDLSERQLVVYRRGRWIESYPVAIGRPGLDTPTGFFFVNQKLRPPARGGPYGVLALGISAFQPALPNWPEGGPVAIHGTNEPHLIGKAVSHGCVRMHNRDILDVSEMVPAGSPVVIKE